MILRPVAALLVATTLLVTGAGLLSTVLALELAAVASPLATGVALSAYFVGLAVGSFKGHVLVQRVGHIRAFAAFTGVLLAVVAGHALWVQPLWWGLLRGLGGVAMAGLFVVIESWFSGTARDEARGRLLSAYLVALFGGLAIGQQLVGLPDPDGHVRFLVVIACVALATVPVAVTTSVAPSLPTLDPESPWVVWARTPLGMTGGALAGVLTSTWYTFGPVYAVEAGATDAGVGTFMSVVMGGALMFQVPIGMLSDRLERRAVIAGTGLGAAGMVSLLALTGPSGLGLLVAAVAGGLAFSVYPVAVANALERAAPEDVLSSSRAMLFAFSLGSAVGPVISGVVALSLGGGALIAVTVAGGVLLGALGVFSEVSTASVLADDKMSFVIQPRGSLGVAELDPRVEQETPEEVVD